MTTRTNIISILFSAAKADLMSEQFQHLVIPQAIYPAIFEQLSNQFRSDDVTIDGRADKFYEFNHINQQGIETLNYHGRVQRMAMTQAAFNVAITLPLLRHLNHFRRFSREITFVVNPGVREFTFTRDDWRCGPSHQ